VVKSVEPHIGRQHLLRELAASADIVLRQVAHYVSHLADGDTFSQDSLELFVLLSELLHSAFPDPNPTLIYRRKFTNRH
jgi:hypothetical protein